MHLKVKIGGSSSTRRDLLGIVSPIPFLGQKGILLTLIRIKKRSVAGVVHYSFRERRLKGDLKKRIGRVPATVGTGRTR